ncbi:Predicted gene 45861 [Apodemus speciosus]|uniref:Predicted gene 45861 n=1 Tax=Apodemus speciosus TaxID=105296 RepID=A0ABQ0F1A7_APOSI
MFTLRKELEESRDIHCIYEILKKHLSEKEKQHRERAAETQPATRLRTRDLDLRNTRDTLKEYPGCPGTHSVDQAGLELRNPPTSASQVLGLKACATTPSVEFIHNSLDMEAVYMPTKRWMALQEAQDQHIGAIKIAQKLKDDLQRVEYENSELKVKVKEQAKKIEKLSGYLQNSCEKPEPSSVPTQAGVRETLEALCKDISPMNQTGVRIQSLQSEPSQRKTVQDTNTSGLKSYEQQCIEELRISNAFLYERYKNRRTFQNFKVD